MIVHLEVLSAMSEANLLFDLVLHRCNTIPNIEIYASGLSRHVLHRKLAFPKKSDHSNPPTSHPPSSESGALHSWHMPRVV